MSASHTGSTSGFASIDEWIAHEHIPLSFDEKFDIAVDRMMIALGNQITLLGCGEPLHSGEEFLTLRNRLFQRLVAVYGFSAIVLENSYKGSAIVDTYVAGDGAATYETVEQQGFAWNRFAANRELVEWMRIYNSAPAHTVKLRFYGTDLPAGGEMTESPGRTLEYALAYLGSIDPAASARHRDIMKPLLGADTDWEEQSAAIQKELLARMLGTANAENQAVAAEEAIALAPAAAALRLAMDDLTTELRMRRPELVSKSDRESFREALHYLSMSRNLLTLHAALARRESLSTLVGMRDAMNAENVAHIAAREQTRGKVLIFMHNAHIQRAKTILPWYQMWPVGSHLDQMFGERFAVIGGAVGASEGNHLGPPEADSFEGRLMRLQSDSLLLTKGGHRLPEGEFAALPTRTACKLPFIPYKPLSAQSLAEFDGVAFLRSATYTRGAPALPEFYQGAK